MSSCDWGNGLMRQYLREHSEAVMPGPNVPVHDFGSPVRFVPQRTRAIWRAKVAAAMIAAAAIGAAILLLLR